MCLWSCSTRSWTMCSGLTGGLLIFAASLFTHAALNGGGRAHARPHAGLLTGPRASTNDSRFASESSSTVPSIPTKQSLILPLQAPPTCLGYGRLPSCSSYQSVWVQGHVFFDLCCLTGK